MPRNAHVPPRIAPRAQIAASLQREMKSNMTAEAFAEQHGPALLQWLQTNTVECACTTTFGPNENLRRGTIDLTTSIACRRCYVPLGLHDVRLPRGDPNPNPCPVPNAHRRRFALPLLRRSSVTSPAWACPSTPSRLPAATGIK